MNEFTEVIVWMSTCWLPTAGRFDEDVVDLDFAEMKATHYCTTAALPLPWEFMLEMGLGS